jgi:cbb3-type cytochrome oxidase maturation protein
MESLYFLVPCALIFIAIAVKVLFWAINNGQYDNLDTEAHRILFDDEKKKIANNEQLVEQKKAQQPQPQQTALQHEQDR